MTKNGLFGLALLSVMVLICLGALVADWSREAYIKDTCILNGYYDSQWVGGTRWDGAWYCVELHPFPSEKIEANE